MNDKKLWKKGSFFGSINSTTHCIHSFQILFSQFQCQNIYQASGRRGSSHANKQRMRVSVAHVHLSVTRDDKCKCEKIKQLTHAHRSKYIHNQKHRDFILPKTKFGDAAGVTVAENCAWMELQRQIIQIVFCFSPSPRCSCFFWVDIKDSLV